MAEATSLRSIARLNNQAAARLDVADVVGAARLLQSALHSFQLLPLQMHEEEGAPENGPMIQHEQLHPMLCDNSAAMSPNNLFPLCPYAFLLPDDEMDISLSRREHFFMVLLYNLSVAMYCVGMMRAKHSSLYKALQLLDLALALYSDDDDQDDNVHAGPLGLVLLAAECHRAHLLCHFGHTNKLLDSQTAILATLRQVEDIIEPDDYMFFYAVTFPLEEFGLPTNAASA
mmetsp:Transcript_8294/g.16050  ORF Transcript_8294/g.16050 Transcript_8294/m.16050 type:complete len:230 (+) Transcript_8294:44-733(+)